MDGWTDRRVGRNSDLDIASSYPKEPFQFYSRTPTEMDGALKGVFPKSETTRDIITKISAFLQLQKK